VGVWGQSPHPPEAVEGLEESSQPPEARGQGGEEFLQIFNRNNAFLFIFHMF